MIKQPVFEQAQIVIENCITNGAGMFDIWRETANVRFGDVDLSGRVTLGSIFSFFQEAAISHAADLGVGLRALEVKGQAWMLSRISIFVERRPAYGETIQVSTWPRQWEKLFALRDYEIKDENEKAVVRARSCWLIIDLEKRRPLRVQPVVDPLPPNHGIDAFPAGAAALNSRETFKKTGERIAHYSDIDYIGHANNARYIQWIQDATDAGLLTKADQTRLDINYLSEVKPGETVELWTDCIANQTTDGNGGEYYSAAYNPADYPKKAGAAFAYEGRRPENGQAVFRAELRV